MSSAAQASENDGNPKISFTLVTLMAARRMGFGLAKL
jgi:hypothetical protein